MTETSDPTPWSLLAEPDPRLRARVAAFLREATPLAPAPSLPEIVLHTAHPASGVGRLGRGRYAPPPYWAYGWAGGLVLARHVLDQPEIVAGRRVLDLGAGSGIVAIAAALAGAARVFAVDIDPHAVVAIELNAVANGVAVTARTGDLTGGPPPPVDLILVGDLFYAPDLALRVTVFLDRCVQAGVAVLVGDPGRIDLPLLRLKAVGASATHDFGEAGSGEGTMSTVYAFTAPS